MFGSKHPDTVSAGALWETLYTLGEATIAETLAAEYLQWLLEADEATLAADQRMVRAQLQQGRAQPRCRRAETSDIALVWHTEKQQSAYKCVA